MNSRSSCDVAILSLTMAVLLLPNDSRGETRTNAVKMISGIEFARPGGVALLLDLHLPEGVKNPPLLMFIHGGRWKAGDRKNCKTEWVARHGIAVASIEYRLSQEALFPAQIHDCKGALRWLRAHATDYGYDASRVVVSGTSAGGHLAALLGTSGDVAELEGDTGGNQKQSSRVQGVVDYYGPTDFVARSKSHPAKCEDPSGSVYQLLGGKVSENLEAARKASPVTYVTADDPPMLILHGTKDTTVLMDQPELLNDRYREAGLEVELVIKEGANHGFSSTSPEDQQAILKTLRKWFQPGKTQSSLAPTVPLMDRVMGVADKDQDGRLNLDEFKRLDVQAIHHGEERFKNGDMNHDGFLDPGELAAELPRKQTWFVILSEGVGACFMRLDTDGNQKLDSKEYRKVSRMGGHAAQHFKAADANHDGFLDLVEFTKHANARLTVTPRAANKNKRPQNTKSTPV